MYIDSRQLGSDRFRKLFGTQHAYYAGSMYKGIASADLVIALGRAGFMGFLGAGGMRRDDVEGSLSAIVGALRGGEAFGANLLHSFGHPEIEDQMVDIILEKGIRTVEASAFMGLSEPLVRYRLSGLQRDGGPPPNRVIAKISRPEVAQAFLSPAPERLLRKLVESGRITEEQASLASSIPVATAVCVESDSGGHTDQGSSFSQFPSIEALRNAICARHGYAEPPLIGMAGGIGTPCAVAAAYMMGADFVATGSVNQCTVEAGTSDAVKDMLQQIDIQDTEYAPSGDMFELGARVQVMKKGTFFPARANKLYEVYVQNESLDTVDPKTLKQIEGKYFKRSIAEVWDETSRFYAAVAPDMLDRAQKSPKVKMGLIFRWYFIHTTRLALAGDESTRVDFQVHCGPALGAFNQTVKGGPMENWRNRKVADVATFLMRGAAEETSQYVARF